MLSAKARRWALIFLVPSAVIALAVALVLHQVDLASNLADIAAVVLSLLALVLSPRQRPVTPPELRERLRAEMESVLHRDAQVHGLLRPELLPMRLLDRDGNDVWRDGGGPVWTASEFQSHAAGLVTGEPPVRMIVHGPPYGGKSTMALMMALGLLAKGHVPLLLNGSSWDPVRESFADWFDKEISSVLGPAYEYEGNLYHALGHGAHTVVIIDEFDALAAHAEQALDRLEREALHSRPLVLFARSGTIDPSVLPAQYVVRTLAPPKPDLLRKHLRQLVGRPAADGRWRPLLNRINRRQDNEVTALLSTPLFLSLARQVCGDPGSGLGPGGLVALVDERGRTSAEEPLLNKHVAMATSTAPYPGLRLRLDTPRGRWWLRNLAVMLRERRRMAWWELHTAIPPAVPMFATALVLLPAYQLALVMPLGLTRGLAIGLAAGVIMGLLRGVTPDARAVAIAGLTAAAGVLGIGLFTLSPAQAAGDAVELGTAFTLTLACRPLLIRRHVLRLPLPGGRGLNVAGRVVATGAVALVACGSALACVVAGALGAEYVLGGGFQPVLVSMATGVGIATMAGRMMAVDLSAPPVPCRLAPRIRGLLGSPLPYLLKAFPPVMLIGFMAGLTGVWRVDGPAYGLQIMIVFGLVLGVPIALVVGTVNWLTQPLPGEPAAAARTIRRGDRWAALGCVAAVALVAAAGIMVLRGPGQSLIRTVEEQSGGFSVQPWQGVLFGLTLGVVLASLHTAWPAVTVGQLWLAARGRLPWRTVTFLEELHTRRLLRRTGPYYQFTYDRLADVLDTGPDPYDHRTVATVRGPLPA
ncbi:hypothetical protein AB0G05_13295 [Nonomuraea wenchangensis]